MATTQRGKYHKGTYGRDEVQLVVFIFVSTYTSHCPKIKIKKLHELATSPPPQKLLTQPSVRKSNTVNKIVKKKLYTKQPLTTDMDQKGGSGSPLISTTLDLVENG